MTLSRRGALRVFGLGAVAAGSPTALGGCSLLPTTDLPRLLASEAPLPEPFTVPLPVPPALRPTATDDTTDYYEMTVRPAEQEILPGLRTTVWGYDGAFPGPTLHARRGRSVVLRQRNELPVPIVTHLHGGRTPPESDGYPTDLVLPADGDFPQHMHDPLAEVTDLEREYEFPFDQRAATLWYHDHRMDFTAPQVWRGLAAFCLVHDDEDDALPLPADDRDVPLMLCDRSFAADGRFAYPALDEELRAEPGVREGFGGGVLGDVLLVNGAPWPRMEVSNTRYRLRLLNASNAREYELSLDPPPEGSEGPAFVQIASDGGLLAAPVERDTIRLAPAERVEVVVDFGRYGVGDSVTLFNLADEDAVGRVMRFDVARDETDDSEVPDRLSTVEALDPADAAVTREFSFESGEIGGHSGWVVNGEPFDPERMDARPELDSTEIWRITSDVAHPVHLHLVHFQVLSVDGGPPPEDAVGWKDTFNLGAAQTAEIIMRFSGYRGRYVFHCHNLEHEDMAMMANFEVV